MAAADVFYDNKNENRIYKTFKRYSSCGLAGSRDIISNCPFMDLFYRLRHIGTMGRYDLAAPDHSGDRRYTAAAAKSGGSGGS